MKGSVQKSAAKHARPLLRPPTARAPSSKSRWRRGRPLQAASAALDAIDPLTGAEIREAHWLPRARESIQAGAHKWAYRLAPGRGPTEGKPPVLLLHGIGSNSFCYRNLMSTFSENGHTCYAPDWIGHGASDKPSPSQFAYDEAAYVDALERFVEAVGLKGPYFLVTHGFILGQYGMLWALRHAQDIQKMVIMNVPVGTGSKLRPELAAYKNPVAFLRPKPESKFQGDYYNAYGLAYVIKYDDAQAYDLPYQESPAASVAVAETMAKCDWKALLNKVDREYCGWKVPTSLLYGNTDPFLNVKETIQFLDTKRTTMQLSSVEGKLGHCPQEDYAESFAGLLLKYFDGGDITVRGISKPKKKTLAKDSSL